MLDADPGVTNGTAITDSTNSEHSNARSRNSCWRNPQICSQRTLVNDVFDRERSPLIDPGHRPEDRFARTTPRSEPGGRLGPRRTAP